MSVFATTISSNLPTYELQQPTLPDLGTLEKPQLEYEYKAPDNMPSLDTNLSEVYSDLKDGLGITDNKTNSDKITNNNKSDTSSNLDLDDNKSTKEDMKSSSTLKINNAEDYFKSAFGSSIVNKTISTEWSSQGLANKLSPEEFSNYLIKAEEKYLPQINAAKEASSKIDYTPIDLSSKWSLMSYEQAKAQSSSLPSYDSLKGQLQSTAVLKPAATPSLTPNAEFNAIKSQVESSKNNNIYAGLESSLPSGVTLNNGIITNNNSAPGIGTALKNAGLGVVNDVKSFGGWIKDKLDKNAGDKVADKYGLESK